MDSDILSLDSKGLCILCLEVPPHELLELGEGAAAAPPPPPGPEESSFKQSRSTSLQMFLRYLKVDIDNVANFKSDILLASEHSSKGNNFKVAASLCDDCSSDVNKFWKLYKQWEMTRLQMDQIVQEINQRMSTGDKESERIREFRRRFGTGKLCDKFSASVMENMRKETKAKCSYKLGKGSLPRVTLMRQELFATLPPPPIPISTNTPESDDNESTHADGKKSERKYVVRRRHGKGKGRDMLNPTVFENIRKETKEKCNNKATKASTPKIPQRHEEMEMLALPVSPTTTAGGDQESCGRKDLNENVEEMVIKVEPLPDYEEEGCTSSVVINTPEYSHNGGSELEQATLTPVSHEKDMISEDLNHSLFGMSLFGNRLEGTPEAGHCGKAPSINWRETRASIGKRVRDHQPRASASKRQRVSMSDGNAGILCDDVAHGPFTSPHEEETRTCTHSLEAKEDSEEEIIIDVNTNKESMFEQQAHWSDAEEFIGQENIDSDEFEDVTLPSEIDGDISGNNDEDLGDGDDRYSGEQSDEDVKNGRASLRLKCPFCEKHYGMTCRAQVHLHIFTHHPVNVFAGLLPPSVTNENVNAALSILINSDTIFHYPHPCPEKGCGQKCLKIDILKRHYLQLHLDKFVLHLRNYFQLPNDNTAHSLESDVERNSFLRKAEERQQQVLREITPQPFDDDALPRRTERRVKRYSEWLRPKSKPNKSCLVQKSECVYCGKMCGERYYFEFHVATQHPIEAFDGLLPPSTTKKSFSAATKIALEELNSTEGSSEGPSRCSLCKKGFGSLFTLKNHLLKKHLDKIIVKLKELNCSDEPEKVVQRKRCESGRRLPYYRYVLSSRTLESDSGTIPCDFCDALFSTNGYRIHHMIERHPVYLLKDFLPPSTTDIDVSHAISSLTAGCRISKETADADTRHNLVQCCFCSKSPKTKYNLRYHLARKHFDKIILKLEEAMDEIEEDGRANFDSEEERKNFLGKVHAHLRKATVPNPLEKARDFNCGFCGSSFKTFGERENHLLHKHALEELATKLPQGTTSAELNKFLTALVENGISNSERYWCCRYCKKKFPTTETKKNDWRLHLLKEHVYGIREGLRKKRIGESNAAD